MYGWAGIAVFLAVVKLVKAAAEIREGTFTPVELFPA
jgi:hypothetical protein